MSLATRCPNCGTVFRVVSDQLRLSGGQVRCGICDTVFNGLEHLQADAPNLPPEAADAPVYRVPAEPRFDSDIPPELMPPQVVARPNLNFPEPPSSLMAAQPSLGMLSKVNAIADEPPPPLPQVLRSGRALPPWPSDGLTADDEQASALPISTPLVPDGRFVPDDPPLQSAATPALPVATEPRPELAKDGAVPELSVPTVLMPQTAAAVVPSWAAEPSPSSRRWVWTLVSGLLLGLALLQLVHLSRDTLAAQWPAARPWLQAYCQQVGCELTWPRRLEALQVLASQLEPQASRPSVYRLALTLRNRHEQPQPWPAIELTILDRQDRVIVRRVLSAADWLSAAGITSADMAARSDIELAFDLELEGPGVSGYRVALFFP